MDCQDPSLSGFPTSRFLSHGSKVQYPDVTIQSCFIVFSEPYTLYKIWIVAILGDGSRSQSSEAIRANTDVDQPSPPQLLNATCFGTGSIYIEWRRPDRFDKSVDYYKLYHKMVTEPTFKSITIQANAKEEIISVRILLIWSMTLSTEMRIHRMMGELRMAK